MLCNLEKLNLLCFQQLYSYIQIAVKLNCFKHLIKTIKIKLGICDNCRFYLLLKYNLRYIL